MPLIETTQPAPNATQSSKKRKRNTAALEELEVDINAPEPPSKKALRRAKKGKIPAAGSTATALSQAPDPPEEIEEAAPETQTKGNITEQAATPKRSGHGIWIGNLPFTTTKADLRTFLSNDTTITEPMITRIHMPAPTDTSSSHLKIKPQNKGFAYVDFSVPEAVAEAVQLSEKLLSGRKVLIKDAHDFEGRPEKKNLDDASQKSAGMLPPTKRIFIGNLPFDTERADLEEHFSQCGEVLDVHVATFEDSGKCKGYAWVTFGKITAAEAAVKGWIIQDPEDSEDDDDMAGEEGDGGEAASKNRFKKLRKKPPRPRKRWVNNFKGRHLRTEFAEDATVRYKKRFGKDAVGVSSKKTNPKGENKEEMDSPRLSTVAPAADKPLPLAKKFDPRKVKPGAALAAAPRLTGGIVPSQGKKITFD
ncbi:MAG: hypothetical protein Q9225_004499 [Loekoesia sp. 1 TL-2023]